MIDNAILDRAIDWCFTEDAKDQIIVRAATVAKAASDRDFLPYDAVLNRIRERTSPRPGNEPWQFDTERKQPFILLSVANQIEVLHRVPWAVYGPTRLSQGIVDELIVRRREAPDSCYTITSTMIKGDLSGYWVGELTEYDTLLIRLAMLYAYARGDFPLARLVDPGKWLTLPVTLRFGQPIRLSSPVALLDFSE